MSFKVIDVGTPGKQIVYYIYVINVLRFLFGSHVLRFYRFLNFFPRFLILKKRCKMQSRNLQTSNEKYTRRMP